MVINRLVEFELLMELKIEQKKGYFTAYLALKGVLSLRHDLKQYSVCPSQ
jgi:hypothetical protein